MSFRVGKENGLMSRRVNRTTFQIIFATMLFASSFLQAGPATVSWDANQETDLAGYKIYYGIESRNYNDVINVGNVTSFTIA